MSTRAGGPLPDRADPAEIAKFDAVAHRFWDEQGEFGPLHRLNPARLAFVAERVALRDAAVLDVGCGGGLLAEGLASRGARVTAIDLAPGMIEVARLHALQSGLAIDYRAASAESLLEESPAGFNLVTCMEMLEHVPDPAATLGVLGGLVAPGGSVVVSTINRNLRSFALAIVGAEYVARLLPAGTHEYERLLRPSEIARFARAARLEVVEVAGLAYNPVTRQARLTGDVSVNYLVHLRRPGDRA
jgi:2-polyprenyl-6-hydroxyphenyl methylase/3-demethylubiquinone-9 3-methyltransferase